MRYFLFVLAKELGMTVRQLTANIDSYEIQEWSAFYKIQNEEKSGNKPLQSGELKDKLKSAFSGAKAKAKRMKR